MKKTIKSSKEKLPKVKVTYVKFPGSNIMVPQVDLGYKTDAVKEVREMRGQY